MNAGELHRLARILREIAQITTGNPGERPPAPSTVAIVEDVSEHPRAAITDIAERTGVAQSLVSRTVDRLVRLGVLLVSADLADRRRTLVSVDPRTLSQDFAHRGDRPISDALSHVTPGLSDDQRSRIEAALDLLGAELLGAPERNAPFDPNRAVDLASPAPGNVPWTRATSGHHFGPQSIVAWGCSAVRA